MSEPATRTARLGERAFDELKAFLGLSLYLYICLGAIILFKRAVLSTVGVNFAMWGIAVVKAMVLAKFMLFARMLHIERRYRDKALIWPIVAHSLVFLLVLLVLTTVEELILGVIHHEPVSLSLQHVVGSSVMMAGATIILMFLVLVPYSAFVCLSDALGEHEVYRLLFRDRSRVDGLRARMAASE